MLRQAQHEDPVPSISRDLTLSPSKGRHEPLTLSPSKGEAPVPVRGPARPVRRRLTVAGAVQGVGFRPFAWRLARDLRLGGWVRNDPEGVTLEVEGPAAALDAFENRLRGEPPAVARIDKVASRAVPAEGATAFVIRESARAGAATARVLPDLATCPDCLAEILDPENRRYRHPFTSCTACGPRDSIMRALPYDRAATTMRGFPMCPRCQAEYDNPAERRFHAQPNACLDCGPQLALWDEGGRVLAERDAALRGAAEAVRDGRILALKGLGGFQLVVDARNEAAVARLRARKRRPHKPFAVMLPDLDAVRAHCTVSNVEAAVLTSAEAPIVLLRRAGRRPAAREAYPSGSRKPPSPGTSCAGLTRASFRPADVVRQPGDGRVKPGHDDFRCGSVQQTEPRLGPSLAPGLAELGVMLPTTPLHHLLLRDLGFPVVMTSGNVSGEPLETDEARALTRLGGIAEVFLVHDRPIARPLDDSIVRVIAEQPTVLRAARGIAPVEVTLPRAVPAPTLAYGGQLKAAPALATGRRAVLGAHVGDLDTRAAESAFQARADQLRALHGCDPEAAVHDLHPDYASTRMAAASGLTTRGVQHHAAHLAACLAENGLTPPLTGVVWDGTGDGGDGTVWGGEVLRLEADGAVARLAHLRPFRLPGGEAAVREPRRAALGLLHAMLGDAAFETAEVVQAFSAQERKVLRTALARGLNVPVTTSAGRLFDGLAWLLGVADATQTYEGQAAGQLEAAAVAAPPPDDVPAPDLLAGDGPLVLDWIPLLAWVRAEREDRGPAELAAAIHATLADAIVAVARHFEAPRLALSGGCFQNRVLTELAVARLEAAGIAPIRHGRVPPNDGGLALGQAALLALRDGKE